MGLFGRFNDVGVTVVVATHDQHLVEASRRRQIALEDGRLTAASEPDGQRLQLDRTSLGTR